MQSEIIEKLKKSDDMRLSESDEEFERVVKCSEIIDKKISPTIADSHYNSNYDIPDAIEVKGFYTGDMEEWLPVLMMDGLIQVKIYAK